ncbi:MAG: hypothetical protein EP329_24350 [Deltaproteobacteria bacterium]|nr:MAG: hypothetical protein EP329_24350 [Deltaproteobacteria bacterium]
MPEPTRTTSPTSTQTAAPAPSASPATASRGDAMRSSLRGQDFATQEQMLSPAAQAGPEAAASEAMAPPDIDVAPPQVEGKGDAKGPMAKEAAVKLLQDAFGTYRTMSGGSLEVLEPDAFKAAYEKVYGKTKYAWDKYVVPKFGSLNGFAHKGVNYINKASANLGTVPHEMLHNNTASDWTPVVGSEFNEGATDYLKQYALKKAGKRSPNSYAKQLEVVTAYVAIASESDLFTAYLKGGADKLVKAKVDATCGSWQAVKDAMQAKEFAKAKVKLRKKA